MSSGCQDIPAQASGSAAAMPDIICVIDTLERVRAHMHAFALRSPAHELRAANHSAVAQALLRHVVAQLHGPDVAARALQRTATGKPFFVDGPAFSLAHAGDLVMVAVSAPGRTIDAIGCDLEVRTSVAMSAPRKASVLACADAILSDVRLTVDTVRSGRAAGATRFTPAPAQPSDDATLAAWVALEAHAKWTGDGVFRVLARGGVFGGVSAPDVTPERTDAAPHAWDRGTFEPAHGAR
ncbi:MAG: hypothetical protein AAGG99_06990, partial [Pseudomonadota bacterium]